MDYFVFFAVLLRNKFANENYTYHFSSKKDTRIQFQINQENLIQENLINGTITNEHRTIFSSQTFSLTLITQRIRMLTFSAPIKTPQELIPTKFIPRMQIIPKIIPHELPSTHINFHQPTSTPPSIPDKKKYQHIQTHAHRISEFINFHPPSTLPSIPNTAHTISPYNQTHAHRISVFDILRSHLIPVTL